MSRTRAGGSWCAATARCGTSWRSALRANGDEEHAELLGYVSLDGGLRDLYRDSHVFLHVSWTEGVPQVLFESFAAGLPVVATAVGGVPELAEGRSVLIPARRRRRGHGGRAAGGIGPRAAGRARGRRARVREALFARLRGRPRGRALSGPAGSATGPSHERHPATELGMGRAARERRPGWTATATPPWPRCSATAATPWRRDSGRPRPARRRRRGALRHRGPARRRRRGRAVAELAEGGVVSIAVAGGRVAPAAGGPAPLRIAQLLLSPLETLRARWRRPAGRSGRSRARGSRARGSPPAIARAAATGWPAAAGSAACARRSASCSPAAAGPSRASLLQTAHRRAPRPRPACRSERRSTTVFESGKVVMDLPRRRRTGSSSCAWPRAVAGPLDASLAAWTPWPPRARAAGRARPARGARAPRARWARCATRSSRTRSAPTPGA